MIIAKLVQNGFAVGPEGTDLIQLLDNAKYIGFAFIWQNEKIRDFCHLATKTFGGKFVGESLILLAK